jgi:hypothetical protein
LAIDRRGAVVLNIVILSKTGQKKTVPPRNLRDGSVVRIVVAVMRQARGSPRRSILRPEDHQLLKTLHLWFLSEAANCTRHLATDQFTTGTPPDSSAILRVVRVFQCNRCKYNQMFRRLSARLVRRTAVADSFDDQWGVYDVISRHACT